MCACVCMLGGVCRSSWWRVVCACVLGVGSRSTWWRVVSLRVHVRVRVHVLGGGRGHGCMQECSSSQHTFMHMPQHACIHAHASARTFTHTPQHTHTFCTHTHVHTRMHAHTSAHTHIYAHIPQHTHTLFTCCLPCTHVAQLCSMQACTCVPPPSPPPCGLQVSDSVMKQLDGLKSQVDTRVAIRKFLSEGLEALGPAGGVGDGAQVLQRGTEG